ncbi:MAG: outer-membrane lipoprotein carrier protein LolA, partial [Mariprofundaceae bacterium]|nr:outer-membrane lipoprotein carrier protein LolA [Mariprofundaceae bacterium]
SDEDVSLPLPAELSGALRGLAKAQGFSARFSQTLQFSDGSQQNYRGELDVLPPGRFSWRYSEPFEQLFISDGFSIWHYEPDLMQVSVLREMSDVDPVVMQLLDGRIGPDDVHLLEAKRQEHRYHVRLAGKTRIWLGLSTGKLAYVEGQDALGNTNRISLQDLNMSPPDAGRFAFVAPEGVDVVPLQ